METRVAVLAVIVREGSSVQPFNELLHQYGQYISSGVWAYPTVKRA